LAPWLSARQASGVQSKPKDLIFGWPSFRVRLKSLKNSLVRWYIERGQVEEHLPDMIRSA
jgi:hypothetical protein